MCGKIRDPPSPVSLPRTGVPFVRRTMRAIDEEHRERTNCRAIYLLSSRRRESRSAISPAVSRLASS